MRAHTAFVHALFVVVFLALHFAFATRTTAARCLHILVGQLQLLFQLVDLLFQVLVFPFQPVHVHGLRCAQVLLQVLERVDLRPIGLLVESHQNFGQGVHHAGLFQILSEFFLAGIGIVAAVVVAIVWIVAAVVVIASALVQQKRFR